MQSLSPHRGGLRRAPALAVLLLWGCGGASPAVDDTGGFFTSRRDVPGSVGDTTPAGADQGELPDGAPAPDTDVANDGAQGDVPTPPADRGAVRRDLPPQPLDESYPRPDPVVVGEYRVALISRPPTLIVSAADDRVVLRSAPGVVQIVETTESRTWAQGTLGVEREEHVLVDGASGSAAIFPVGEGASVRFFGARGSETATLSIEPAPGGLRLEARVSGSGSSVTRADEAHFRFDCGPNDRFYGLGSQSDAAEHRGHTVPIRVTEQGLGKDPRLGEGQAAIEGHLHDAYYPLPYVLVARPDPGARAHGVIAEAERRTRFLLCSAEPEVFEVQIPLREGGIVLGEGGVDADPTGGVLRSPAAALTLLGGPTPADVVRQFTALHGRARAIPDWGFGPWLAFEGQPADVGAEVEGLVERDVPATAVWFQKWRDHEHPDLPGLVTTVHSNGLRLLTYFSPFVDDRELTNSVAAVAAGFVVTDAQGEPYSFARLTGTSALFDPTHAAAREWMAGRVRRAIDAGVDGWMAEFGDWVAPDMHFADGRTGLGYANIYPVDWQRIHDEVIGDSDHLFLSRSGYLGANRHSRIVWAGDQNTDFDEIDGLPSVIPIGTSLGLAGVSAYGHDIAGYSGGVTDPSTRELFFRWTALGAYTPVMRTSMGANSRANWRWDSDAGTITQFRRYALQHLRLLPYLKALHREAMETGLPAMRHVLLEFPGWPGAARAHHSFLLGSALFVAPVVEQGAASREVELPPGRWFDFADATVHDGPATVEVEAELSDIPVFLREGTMVPMLGLKVRGVDAPTLEVARQTASEALAEHVDIHVGYARRAATELADGTSIRLLRARAEFASAGVRYESDGTDLAACTLGQKPQTHDCFAPSADGRILLAPRTGPGSLLLGRAATGRDPVGVVITGGSDDRRYVIRLYGVQVGGEGR